MAVSDSGSWKLIIYPLAIIIIFGTIITIMIQPFLDNGIPAESQPSQFGETLIDLVETGNIDLNLSTATTIILFPLIGATMLTADIVSAILPQDIKDFIADSIRVYYYIPEPFQTIITAFLIVTFICIAYGVYVMATMLIP